MINLKNNLINSDVNRYNSNINLVDQELKVFFLLRSICDKENNKNYFEFSDDNYENLEFIILNENMKYSVELLTKFSTSSVNIFSFYIVIFSYIGITLVKKAFFEQSHYIWTMEVPNS